MSDSSQTEGEGISVQTQETGEIREKFATEFTQQVESRYGKEVADKVDALLKVDGIFINIIKQGFSGESPYRSPLTALVYDTFNDLEQEAESYGVSGGRVDWNQFQTIADHHQKLYTPESYLEKVTGRMSVSDVQVERFKESVSSSGHNENDYLYSNFGVKKVDGKYIKGRLLPFDKATGGKRIDIRDSGPGIYGQEARKFLEGLGLDAAQVREKTEPNKFAHLALDVPKLEGDAAFWVVADQFNSNAPVSVVGMSILNPVLVAAVEDSVRLNPKLAEQLMEANRNMTPSKS